MAVKKVEIRPEDNNYGDILYPKTSTDMVVNDASGEPLNQTITNLVASDSSIDQKISDHMLNGANPHGTTKAQVGLGNVDNVKQMPIAGGTFTGIAKSQNNTSYTTAQLRNIIISTANPSGGNNGDLWFKYV